MRRRFLVLVVIGAMTAFFGYFAAKTELVTSFGDLLPQNHPFIKIAHKYEQYFGTINNVTIMIEAQEGTIYHAEIIKKIVNMTQQHGSGVRDPARLGAIAGDRQLFPPAGGRRHSEFADSAQRQDPQDPADLAELRQQRPQKSRRGLRPLRLAR